VGTESVADSKRAGAALHPLTAQRDLSIRLLALFFLIGAVIFFFTNWPAYQGYFADDDFSNFGWPTFVGNDVFIHGLLSPVYTESHFRPIGFLFFRYAGRAFDLNYPPYVLAVQLIHLLNVLLLYLLLKKLGFSRVAAGTGALFYGLQAVVMQVYWEPMFVFDLLCGTLCLLTLLLYVYGQWILGMLTLWLAYKSKELAVMLPFALAAYEIWLGPRKWKRLIPYFAITLSFGLQAAWVDRHLDPINSYALHFTPAALWQTVSYYSSAIFFVPFGGLALVILPLLVHDRRLYVGLILTGATLLPLLGLTGKVSWGYWYVPLIGLALAIPALAERMPRRLLVVLLIAWLSVNYAVVHVKGRELLAVANERREYITALQAYARQAPHLQAVIYKEVPEHMYSWGVEDGIRKVFGWKVTVLPESDPQAKKAMSEFPMAVISYDKTSRTIRGALRTGN